MLSLSRKADYALLIITALANASEGFTSLRELARKHHLPYRFAAQVVRPLVACGILESREGVRGGYRLARATSDITIQDIVAAEEGGVTLAACLDPTKDFACAQKAWCSARRGMPALQQLVLQALSQRTVADLLNSHG
jgi:Rrf2 family protein